MNEAHTEILLLEWGVLRYRKAYSFFFTHLSLTARGLLAIKLIASPRRHQSA